MERKKLAAARAKKHWTQEEAAQRIGVDDNTLSKWERGKEAPRSYNIQRLCEVYGLTAGELGLDEEEERIAVDAQPSPSVGFVANDLSMRLMALAFVPRSYQEIQDRIMAILQEHDGMQNSSQITRREALSRLATLPMISLFLGESAPRTSHPEETLTQCSASIAACWELSRSKENEDLILAFQGASAYLPSLKAIVNESSHHRQQAAGLAAQGALLLTLLGWHLKGASQALPYAQEAQVYAREAGDAPLLLTVLDYTSWLHYYNRNTRQALRQAESALPLLRDYGNQISSRLSSGMLSTLAVMQAKAGKPAETTLRKASDTFFGGPSTPDHPFIYMDYAAPELVLNDGMVRYLSANHIKALDSLSQLVDAQTLKLKVQLPERSHIEGVNLMALASLKRKEKDMDETLHYWEFAISGARQLQSEQRFGEAVTAYEMMEAVWPGERRIKELRDLTVHW